MYLGPLHCSSSSPSDPGPVSRTRRSFCMKLGKWSHSNGETKLCNVVVHCVTFLLVMQLPRNITFYVMQATKQMFLIQLIGQITTAYWYAQMQCPVDVMQTWIEFPVLSMHVLAGNSGEENSLLIGRQLKQNQIGHVPHPVGGWGNRTEAETNRDYNNNDIYMHTKVGGCRVHFWEFSSLGL